MIPIAQSYPHRGGHRELPHQESRGQTGRQRSDACLHDCCAARPAPNLIALTSRKLQDFSYRFWCFAKTSSAVTSKIGFSERLVSETVQHFRRRACSVGHSRSNGGKAAHFAALAICFLVLSFASIIRMCASSLRHFVGFRLPRTAECCGLRTDFEAGNQ
jgi:hypothetical protein